jgi:hypothetical protein
MTPLLGMMASGATGSKQSSYESIATIDVSSSTGYIEFTSIPRIWCYYSFIIICIQISTPPTERTICYYMIFA